MATDATSASDTSTSALMSNSVTSPMTAPRMMGAPHSTMAIQAGLKGSVSGAKKLNPSATADTASSAKGASSMSTRAASMTGPLPPTNSAVDTETSSTSLVRGSRRTVRSTAPVCSSSTAMPYAMPARLKCFPSTLRPMNPPTMPVTKHAINMAGYAHGCR